MGLSACGVKNFPKETPFVFENKIDIINPQMDKNEKTILRGKLTTQLADSLQVRVREKFIFFKSVIDPAAFDTGYARQSAENMDIYLKTIGFYNGKTTFTYRIDTVAAKGGSAIQYRTTTTFTVNTGPPFRIDSIAFELKDTTYPQLTRGLQHLADSTRPQTLLQRGVPFSEQLAIQEMDRLVDLFRNHGYVNFSREHLVLEADTFFLPLLNPFLDPFERIAVLQEAQKRQQNPQINIYVKLRPNLPPTVLRQYLVGDITVYPDYSATADTSGLESVRSGVINIRSREEKYRPAFIAQHVYLQPGKLYRLNDVNRTFSDLSNLGTWQFIKIEPRENKTLQQHPSDTPRIDFDLLLAPGKKYTFSTDLESVFNQTQQTALATAGNLIGFGLNLGIRNRNFDRQGIQASNTVRGGVEYGFGQINRGLQAIELTYSNSFTLPKLLFLGNAWKDKFLFKRTLINTNISLIDRNIRNNGLFSLTNIGSSFGWQVRNFKNEIISFRPLNVEYVRLNSVSQAFEEQLNNNPFLRFSFNTGLVIGSVFSFTKPQIVSKRNPNRISFVRVGIEESGALFGRLKNVFPVFDRELFEYIKGEVELKHEMRFKKSSLVFRTAMGAGYLYNDTVSMPFFKQFTGGGPNSMRAWPLRSIGPGSTPLQPREISNRFFSRSGDMMLEGNAEYRFDIASVLPNTFVIRGALFTDVGNVWNFRNQSNRGNDTAVFQLKNLYRELSVTVGSGIRFDFVGLFLLRLDFGFRVKNPAYPFVNDNNGWRFPKVSLAHLFRGREIDRQWRYENFNLSFGINYPF
ncbi:MAG: BamA/TamA family outer membrane protein [Lacibacter sp.]